MTIPLLVLATLAVVALVLALPLHGEWGMVFEHYLAPVFEPATANLLRAEHLHAGAHPSWPYFVAWAIAAGGTLVAWLMYVGALREVPAKLAATFPALYRFTLDKFRVDELYEAIVLEPFRLTAYYLWRVVDVFAIDGLLVNGIARTIGFAGNLGRMAQNGDVQRYAAIMAVAAAVILWSIIGVGGQ
jgi:NADH-quinone oxidoreductase subunit L